MTYSGTPALPNGGFFGGLDSPTGLKIITATYGSPNKTVDVSGLLNSKIQNNTLQTSITNEAMGGDPDVGADKILRLVWEFNGIRQMAVINEGKSLRVP